MTTQSHTAPIPQPKPDPILGNIRDLDPRAPVQSMARLARTYGPIYRLSLPGGDVIFVGSQELVDELSDETRFEKGENHALENLREFAGDGLVTAHGDEANWGEPHRILMPVFGPAAMRDMFDGMHDIADQLLDGRDPLTGEGLSDENIRYQMVTFLAAGHETTSGLLSFALYFLLNHPDVMARAQASVGAPAILHTSSNAPMMLFVIPTAAGEVVLPYMAVVLASMYLSFVFRPWLQSKGG